MGYYNDPPTGRKKTSRVGVFLAALAGVAMGAILVWLLMAARPDLLPGGNNGTQEVSVEQPDGQLETTAVSVTTDVTEAVDIASGSVVGVTNLQASQDFFSGSQTQEVGTGSGVIYKNENGTAYVITNQHVIYGASDIEVTMSDGSKIEAELIGSDIWTDLAVLRMDGSTVENVIEFGDSGVLKRGETVIAIGNPLGLDFSGSVTTGVVSGTDRAVPMDINGDGQEDWHAEVLQTDAAINPGNSGGALINLAGQLVGINSMKIATGAVEGIGFAIPVNSAMPVIQSLEENGEVIRPAMGVTLLELAQVPQAYRQDALNLPEDVNEGVVVNSVMAGSAAAEAGMQQYDVIVEMDGETVGSIIELRQHLYNDKQVGETMTVTAYRNGELLEFELRLVENSSL